MNGLSEKEEVFVAYADYVPIDYSSGEGEEDCDNGRGSKTLLIVWMM